MERMRRAHCIGGLFLKSNIMVAGSYMRGFEGLLSVVGDVEEARKMSQKGAVRGI